MSSMSMSMVIEGMLRMDVTLRVALQHRQLERAIHDPLDEPHLPRLPIVSSVQVRRHAGIHGG
jgi:hypothetical protein